MHDGLDGLDTGWEGELYCILFFICGEKVSMLHAITVIF